VALVLAVCVGATLAEMFDRWDDTVPSANDSEGNLVVVALCVGIGFSTAAALLRHVPPVGSADPKGFALAFVQYSVTLAPSSPASPDTSPPLILRV
jgi:hypothetical protein